jgi:hypothetical protein
MTANVNPNLSFDAISEIMNAGVGTLLSSSFLWITLSAFAFVVISHKFTSWYANDLQSDQSDVEAFFEKMATPVDVEKEVMVDGAKEVNVFPLIGSVAIGLSIVSLLILFVQSARTNVTVNFAMSGVLLVIGLAMFLSKYRKNGGAE